jgi:hypothetical protein
LHRRINNGQTTADILFAPHFLFPELFPIGIFTCHVEYFRTEVLEAVGIVDMDEIVSDEQSESMKQRILSRLGDVKRTITKMEGFCCK